MLYTQRKAQECYATRMDTPNKEVTPTIATIGAAEAQDICERPIINKTELAALAGCGLIVLLTFMGTGALRDYTDAPTDTASVVTSVVEPMPTIEQPTPPDTQTYPEAATPIPAASNETTSESKAIDTSIPAPGVLPIRNDAPAIPRTQTDPPGTSITE